jgi:hypothetical protein
MFCSKHLWVYVILSVGNLTEEKSLCVQRDLRYESFNSRYMLKIGYKDILMMMYASSTSLSNYDAYSEIFRYSTSMLRLTNTLVTEPGVPTLLLPQLCNFSSTHNLSSKVYLRFLPIQNWPLKLWIVLHGRGSAHLKTFTSTGQHKHGRNADVHYHPKWDTNQRTQGSSV